MRIDCYVSTLLRLPERQRIARDVLAALSKESLRITVLDAGSPPDELRWLQDRFPVVQQPRDGSLHRRYLLAELLATTDYYLLCDDDCLPKTEYWLPRALALMRDRPLFGQIALRMEHCDWARDSQFADGEVVSVTVCGGMRLIRRGVRTAPFHVPLVWHPLDNDDWDWCQAMRASGVGVGSFEKIYCTHVGRDCSNLVQRDPRYESD